LWTSATSISLLLTVFIGPFQQDVLRELLANYYHVRLALLLGFLNTRKGPGSDFNICWPVDERREITIRHEKHEQAHRMSQFYWCRNA
jgi:hypothetical protein